MPLGTGCNRRQYAAATGFSYQYAYTEPLAANSAIAVCLWTAIKFLATPGAARAQAWSTLCTCEGFAAYQQVRPLQVLRLACLICMLCRPALPQLRHCAEGRLAKGPSDRPGVHLCARCIAVGVHSRCTDVGCEQVTVPGCRGGAQLPLHSHSSW